MRRIPTVKFMIARGFSPDVARRLRDNLEGRNIPGEDDPRYCQHHTPPPLLDRILDGANDTLEGFGVEALRSDGAWDRYWGDVVALYVNNGDTYTETLIYEVESDRFRIMSMGDWIEWVERRGVTIR